MKLNHDCVRALLLFIEDNLEYQNQIIVNEISIGKFESSEIIYAADKLIEAGYITADRHIYSGHNLIPTIVVLSMTWNGHKFLDTIRDNHVWKQTKTIVSKFSSVSLALIENIASKVIIELIEKNLMLT